ncbi:MAG: response regulator [Jatrophihabitans sp.]|nr:MAG: response regulator [Jatrophihabitans sp.]
MGTTTEQDAPAGRELVLVADDDRDIRDLVTVKLRQAGYEVVAVGDGVEALAVLRERRPALAVLDVMMPGLSGLDVVRQARESGEDAGVAVVLLTAKSREFDIETGFAVGADDYIVKPFSPREFLSRVNAVLSRVRG